MPTRSTVTAWHEFRHTNIAMLLASRPLLWHNCRMDESSLFPHRKTCKRYNLPGHAHALTFSCFQRQPFLSKDRTREWLIASLDRARRSLAFELWAYVIMPEHCHMLVYPRADTYSISRFLEAIKLPVTRSAVAWVKRYAPEQLPRLLDEQPNGQRAYRFWQRGGEFDQNLVEPRSIHAMVDYIHANPVRRGLVERADAWKWSSAAFYAGGQDVPLVPDAGSLPMLDATR